jgi:hypothetical protein
MNRTMKRILTFGLAMLVLLSACAPQAAATQDPALVQQLVEQSVQLTVAAQNLETAQAQAAFTATPIPSDTALPPTAAPALPTATPFVVVPPTAVVSGGGGSGTSTKPDFACDVLTRPFDNTKYAKGDDFDVKWIITNTGKYKWIKGLDLNYSYGPKMTSTATIELPAMEPGDTFEILLDATAPTEEGQQIMVWKLEGDFCFPYVAIIVK